MKFEWTEPQLELLLKMKIPYDVLIDLTDDQICDLDDYVSDFMVMHYVDDTGVYGDGLVCESILDIINSV